MQGINKSDFPVSAVPPPDGFSARAEALSAPVTDAALDRLGCYVAAVDLANRSFNLTAPCSLDELWIRHVLDSLSLHPFLSRFQQIGDLGSGAGFPAIPLAVLNPDRSFTVVESVKKKADFMEQTAGRLGLTNVTVCNDRAEILGRQTDFRQSFEAVTARALAPLTVLIELALPLLKTGGSLLAMKGRKAEEELREAAKALRELHGESMECRDLSEAGDRTACLVEIRKTAETPDRYPRRPGLPAKRPLSL